MSEVRPNALRVLVVEDEPLIGMVMEDVLTDLGWEMVGPAASVADALSLASTDRIDCAILDLNVRGGRTYPIADLLVGRGIPLLVASGYGEGTLPDHLRRETRLAKPYTSDQLRSQLQLLSTRAGLRDRQG